MKNSFSILEFRSMQIAGLGTKDEEGELGPRCTTLHLSTSSTTTPTPPHHPHHHPCQLHRTSAYKLPFGTGTILLYFLCSLPKPSLRKKLLVICMLISLNEYVFLFQRDWSEIFFFLGGGEFYIKGISKRCKYMREALSGAREGYDYAHNRFSLDTHSLHLGIKTSVKKKKKKNSAWGWYGRLVVW